MIIIWDISLFVKRYHEIPEATVQPRRGDPEAGTLPHFRMLKMIASRGLAIFGGFYYTTL